MRCSDDAGKNEFEVVHSFDGHIGSVKSVVAVKENSADEMSGGNEFGGQGKVVNREAVSSLNRSYIMFTCGSRSSLKCNRVFYHADGYVSTSLLAEIGTPMNSLKTKPRDLYDDLRFLSMNVIPVKNTEFSYCLAVACSDGYTRYSNCVQEIFNDLRNFDGMKLSTDKREGRITPGKSRTPLLEILFLSESPWKSLSFHGYHLRCLQERIAPRINTLFSFNIQYAFVGVNALPLRGGVEGHWMFLYLIEGFPL